MKILIIEDNKDIADMLQKYLQTENFDVETSNDAKYGYELIKNKKFDLILLDLCIPEYSGEDLLVDLEKENLLSKQRIILLTASIKDNDELVRLQKFEIETILRKPIKMLKLLSVINQENKKLGNQIMADKIVKS